MGAKEIRAQLATVCCSNKSCREVRNSSLGHRSSVGHTCVAISLPSPPLPNPYPQWHSCAISPSHLSSLLPSLSLSAYSARGKRKVDRCLAAEPTYRCSCRVPTARFACPPSLSSLDFVGPKLWARPRRRILWVDRQFEVPTRFNDDQCSLFAPWTVRTHLSLCVHHGSMGGEGRDGYSFLSTHSFSSIRSRHALGVCNISKIPTVILTPHIGLVSVLRHALRFVPERLDLRPLPSMLMQGEN